MRARALALSILSSAAVITVGWQLGSQGQAGTSVDSAATAPAAPTTTAPEASAPATTGPATSAPATTAPQTSAPAATGPSGTFTGTSAATRFGDVQVQITVENGSITDVVALHLTDRDPRSVSISNRAAPVLREQVLAAQSANVQGVSGATYTSDGYLSSLQSALDQAGL
ncbi:FMN-binding protein [Herbiconiux ginsengi]|uniref:Uncharacterized protein, contains FMN-binding domain n=1 Tax=Herbiconiux ginsengi TaxID=381665 RepID=A0A1H3QAE7_9MICO|nr:FMN-binding protein [Herbiconiux ginsengi]SDZ10366.1 Uncharacterized protein, contains FMN-binding domain [Herbiconiux ginsengi]